ncbi:anti-sigma factor family protein [Maribellus maritimus]|uniref:anti-sigma factor family protein n=1 Tax=Maribellus maritimus TaxID=2870838 RepID=UPI001EEA3BE3|nr:zf-HC2 domain-containing protein [Maribellus maritimus]MCG6189346.1 zf-HC2 domain-containing protein [Maribellus maritimus]
MNCFNEEIFQKYVDGECSETEIDQIEAHIEKCVECKTNVELLRERSENIKKQINALVGDVPEMPGISTLIKEKKPVIPIRKKLAYGMAAASLFLLIVLFFGKSQQSQPEETILFYNIDYEIDANKPLTEQEMVLYITDENGFGLNNDSN